MFNDEWKMAIEQRNTNLLTAFLLSGWIREREDLKLCEGYGNNNQIYYGYREILNFLF